MRETINFAQADANDVAGLHGRLRLQKATENPKDDSWMETERKNIQAYEYLCHVGEAKEWIEACTKTKIASIDKLEEELRNGIVLANLAKTFDPNSVKKIFDDRVKLQYRHSDNINYLLKAMKNVGLPDVFFFELVDLYEKKNIPKVIYCIHALSYLLARKGLAPHIKNLVGKLKFTDEQLDATQQSLDAAGIVMPQFGNIVNTLAEEMKLTPEELRWGYLVSQTDAIIKCQAYVRGYLARKKYNERKKYWKDNEDNIVKIQALWKGRQARKAYLEKFQRFKDGTPQIIKLQALWRGRQARKKFLEKKQFYQNHLKEIVKIQAMWKRRHAEKAYRALASLNNPSVNILKEFLHLLDDSEHDFEEELELEKLRQMVIQLIRENIQTDSELGELDIKISLLVKNRISLEEVVRLTTKKKKQELSEASNNENHNPFDLKGKDKETRAKLELYGQLFYLIQTQPAYLAKLMFSMNKKSGGIVTKLLENVVLALYGYAQNIREEYLLLNLITACIQIEVDEISSIGEFWRSNPLFVKLLLHYTRGAKEREFLRQLLQPLIKNVINNHSLELETDVVAIYKNLIREEESKTGEKSSRSYDATPQTASADPEVQKIQQANIQKLKEITETYLKAIIKSIDKMPFGVRYIGMQLRNKMSKKFPGNEDEINKMVGNLIYYRYMNPAIVAPEAFDVIEANISPTQRKNLADIAKSIHHISVHKLYPKDDTRMDQLNDFIDSSSKTFSNFFKDVATNVMSAEDHFCYDGTIDVGSVQKLTVYISASEILHVHRQIVENLEDIVTNNKDSLCQILNDLGTPPPAGAENSTSGDIKLLLINRNAKSLADSQAFKNKQLLQESKRLVLTVIRVQSGKNLLEMLEAPVTPGEELLFEELQRKETERNQEKKEFTSNISISSPNLLKSDFNLASPIGKSEHTLITGSNFNLYKNSDGTKMTYSQVKKKCLENMDKLEKEGVVKKSNHYQDMLNSIAKDMLNKHRRRSQRQREIENLKKTLKSLEEKKSFLSDQKKSYMDYITACMLQLGSTKKGKSSKKPVIFTRQYNHMRQLQKTGQVPKFGSFKWSAEELHKKGVLISIDDYSPKQFKQITMTISSDEAGIFKVDASFLGIKLPDSMTVKLEDLLEAQYNGVQVMALFDMAKVNVNLLIFLINKKFYL